LEVKKMEAQNEEILLKCGACNSTQIGCTQAEEISYDHIAQISYRCLKCGHKGTIVIDCVRLEEVRVMVE
jgi:DNA-directed RNA polymerase subunit M/transcription elongation factor TFIIS